VYFFYRYQSGQPVLNVREVIEKPAGSDQGRKKRHLKRQEISLEKTVLAQRSDPDQYPEITYLGNEFSQIRIYKDWNFNAASAPRIPQQADAQADFLNENARNLALVLNNLWRKPQTKRLILEKFQKFYAGAKDIAIITQGGTVQIYVHEEGLDDSIPATRLSDGTLRYLCLLTILCHPSPPPLICIEEPELGMHPDILPIIAELLIDASHRTQLIVTTHSDALVSALTELPDSVLVCEHDSAGTRLNRLDPERLKGWLEKYSLGQLWQMGEIGGTRW
jgi:predicted ATPase